MFKTDSPLFSGIVLACALIANGTLAHAAPAAAPAAAASAAKSSEPASLPATIGTITDLSLKIKTAEKQKQLRELQTVAKPTVVPGGAGGPTSEIPSIAVFGGVRPGAANPATGVAPPVQQADLAIQSVNSIGGKFTAVSNLGRDLVVGSRFSQGTANWRITSITSDSVGVEKCVKNKCVPMLLPIGY